MRPSVVLDLKRSAVREAASRFRTVNPRVFGSVLHGTDQDGSDLDLLVDALPSAPCSIWAACRTRLNPYSASMCIF
jgi:predicted nucleotidyltransferase